MARGCGGGGQGLSRANPRAARLVRGIRGPRDGRRGRPAVPVQASDQPSRYLRRMNGSASGAFLAEIEAESLRREGVETGGPRTERSR